LLQQSLTADLAWLSVDVRDSLQQVAQLSQRDRASRHLSFGKKYKCEKRASNTTLSYGVDDHFTVLRVTMFVQCKIMQHLGVKYIWRFELGFFICFSLFFCLRNLGFKSPVATLPPTLQQLTPRGRHACRVIPSFIRLNPPSCNASKHLS